MVTCTLILQTKRMDRSSVGEISSAMKNMIIFICNWSGRFHQKEIAGSYYLYTKTRRNTIGAGKQARKCKCSIMVHQHCLAILMQGIIHTGLAISMICYLPKKRLGLWVSGTR